MAAVYTEEVTDEAVRRAEEGIGIWLEPDRLAAARGLGRLGERLLRGRCPLSRGALRQRFVAMR